MTNAIAIRNEMLEQAAEVAEAKLREIGGD